MRLVIRYFFRTLRLILTPFVLLSEKLGTGKRLERSAKEQQNMDTEANSWRYTSSKPAFCVKVRKQMVRLNLNIKKQMPAQ